MRWNVRLLVVAVAALAGAAYAQATRLTAEEVRAELVGVELIGVVEDAGLSWSECIEPSGRTSYLRPGLPAHARRDEGRLEVTPEGALCFTYRSSGFSRWACYWAERNGANYRFNSAQGFDQVFATTSVRRDVRSCERADAPIS